MTFLRLPVAALLAITLLGACNPFKSDHVDSRYPTVSQQDAYDVSWGLPARKARGNPKLRYQYNARNEQASGGGAAAPAAAPAPAPEAAPAAAPAAAPTPINPVAPAGLR